MEDNSTITSFLCFRKKKILEYTNKDNTYLFLVDDNIDVSKEMFDNPYEKHTNDYGVYGWVLDRTDNKFKLNKWFIDIEKSYEIEDILVELIPIEDLTKATQITAAGNFLMNIIMNSPSEAVKDFCEFADNFLKDKKRFPVMLEAIEFFKSYNYD